MPFSLLIYTSSIHFDRERNSDLEQMIHSYIPSKSDDMRVKRCVDFIKKYGVDKYNLTQNKADLILDHSKENILVIGQVDSDDSIKYACRNAITSNQLVYFVKKRHPEANIIYRPHPEVLRNLQSDQENYLTLKGICVLDESLSSLSSLLSCKALQTVYTISSLSGFESLLYQKNVFVYGSPFYAGWGLTNDIETNDRGIASLNHLFYCTYIKYPTYICPLYGEKITIEEALVLVVCIREGLLLEKNQAKSRNNNVNCEELIKEFDKSLLINSRAIKLLREV
jgi:capsular polysaccharide export protein